MTNDKQIKRVEKIGRSIWKDIRFHLENCSTQVGKLPTSQEQKDELLMQIISDLMTLKNHLREKRYNLIDSINGGNDISVYTTRQIVNSWLVAEQMSYDYDTGSVKYSYNYIDDNKIKQSYNMVMYFTCLTYSSKYTDDDKHKKLMTIYLRALKKLKYNLIVKYKLKGKIELHNFTDMLRNIEIAANTTTEDLRDTIHEIWMTYLNTSHMLHPLITIDVLKQLHVEYAYESGRLLGVMSRLKNDIHDISMDDITIYMFFPAKDIFFPTK